MTPARPICPLSEWGRWWGISAPPTTTMNRPCPWCWSGRLPPWTLACAALLISVVLGIPAGIVAAVKRNSVSDAVIRVLALLGQCMPAFWLGIMLIMLFAVKLAGCPLAAQRMACVP